MDPLETFLVGYFNQDFDLIFGEPEDVVRAFGRTTPAVVAAARDGVIELLRTFGDDQALLDETLRIGSEYQPDDPRELRELLEYAVTHWAAAESRL